MLARSNSNFTLILEILTFEDLHIYEFAHLISRDNVKMNIIAPSKDWKYVLLGF